MRVGERIFHSVLFELGAIAVSTVVVLGVGNVQTETAIGTSVVMAIMAMVWNFAFNYVFDTFFTGKREARSFGLRLFHTLSFEGGLLLFTVPVIAYLLNLTLWQALLADIGLTLLITLYALLFNWAYDHLRLRWVET
ncbi:PACE efflux transporter [Muribacter muris]|uniref:PACE efflux transporter n=1 Tax=Muribacter muris TaxID=67855 RepID=A0A4Y9JXT0_9PAST|nr:PACE efflux transporter [Muribacter muris]MBF0785057.1 PACE efflux transporter [Muribacter muris]MBF0826728.1 PACE efflux transporter [Muribacter muris]TFV10298.1 PACE efflux transporter [Muribacter muris]